MVGARESAVIPSCRFGRTDDHAGATHWHGDAQLHRLFDLCAGGKRDCFLCPLRGTSVLALPPVTLVWTSWRQHSDLARCRLRGFSDWAHSDNTASKKTVSCGGLAVVSGHDVSDDRNCAGGRSSDGQPLCVYAIHRFVLDGDVGDQRGSGRVADFPAMAGSSSMPVAVDGLCADASPGVLLA